MASTIPASDSAALEDDDVDFEVPVIEQAAPVRRKLSRLVRVCVNKENVGPRAELPHKPAASPSASPPESAAAPAVDGPTDAAASSPVSQTDAKMQPSTGEGHRHLAAHPAHAPADAAATGTDSAAEGAAPEGDAPAAASAAAADISEADASSDAEADGHSDGEVSGKNTAVDDEAAGSDAEGSEAAGEGAEDGSDAEGAAWDEEDELDDAFRRERLYSMTQGGSGSDSEEGGGSGSGSDGEGSQGAGRKKRSKKESRELNAQTQRMLRDSAVRDRIGKGHNPDIAPLSGIVAKLKAQQEALAAKADAKKALRRKVHSPPVAPPPAAVHQQAPADDEELMILSDGEASQEGPGGAGAPTGGPMDESQGLGQGLGGPSWSLPPYMPDSLPLQASLNLELESQPEAEEAAEGDGGSGSSDDEGSAEEDDEEEEEGEEEGSGEEDGVSQAGSSDDEEQHSEEGLESGSEDGSADEEEEEEEGAGAGSQPVPASDAAVGAEDAASPVSAAAGASLAPQRDAAKEGAAAADAAPDARQNAFKLLQQAGTGKQRPGSFFKDNFVDMEAEMSDDEGHSDDGEDDDADADGMLADLMGTAKEEGARDGRLRAGLHAEWAKEQDQAEMAAVVAGMQRGWRKPGGNAFEDDEYEGTDREARRRLAAMDGGEGEVPEFDLAALFPTGAEPGGGDGDSSGDDAEIARAYTAQRLLDASQDVAPLSILDAGSQEMLAMLSGPAPQERAPPPKRSWLGALGALRPDLAGAAQPAQRPGSFLGRHGSMPKQRSSSVLMGGATSRSFVFRNDDSNSALGPPKVEGSMNKENNASRVVGPTSFAGGIRQIAAASKRAAVAGRAPALMTMLAGSGGARDHDAGGNDMNALKMASFKSKR